MDEEVLNLSIRRFLKKVGITAQREIECAVREAGAQLPESGFDVSVELKIAIADDPLVISGSIQTE